MVLYLCTFVFCNNKIYCDWKFSFEINFTDHLLFTYFIYIWYIMLNFLCNVHFTCVIQIFRWKSKIVLVQNLFPNKSLWDFVLFVYFDTGPHPSLIQIKIYLSYTVNNRIYWTIDSFSLFLKFFFYYLFIFLVLLFARF